MAERRRRTKGAARRQAIVDAAVELIAENEQPLSHRAAARRAGVPDSAPSYYFESIEELTVEAFRDAIGAFVERIHLVCRAIRALPVPVVARLHGAAIGGGLEIAAACDLRVAAEGTKFSMPEVRLGIPSVVEAALLPRLMGSGRAAWLVMTGEAIDARRAMEWGLIEEVGGEEAVQVLVGRLLAGERAALAAQKRLAQLWDEAPLERSIAESVRAFAQAYAGGHTIFSRRKGNTN